MSDDSNQPLTKEHVKERLQYLGDLIQQYRETKLSKSELGLLVKEAIESSGVAFYGTEMDRIESAIYRYESAMETGRVRKFVTDGLDELFGLDDTSRGADCGE